MRMRSRGKGGEGGLRASSSNTWLVGMCSSCLRCCGWTQQREVKQKWWQWSMEAIWLNKSRVPAVLPSLLPRMQTKCEIGEVFACIHVCVWESVCEEEVQGWGEEAEKQRISLCETGWYCPTKTKGIQFFLYKVRGGNGTNSQLGS